MVRLRDDAVAITIQRARRMLMVSAVEELRTSEVAPRVVAAPGVPSEVHFGRLALVAAVGLAVWLLPRPATVDPRAWRLLAVFVATIVGLIVKPVPMGAVTFLSLAVALLT